jgi:hypothetical protein
MFLQFQDAQIKGSTLEGAGVILGKSVGNISIIHIFTRGMMMNHWQGKVFVTCLRRIIGPGLTDNESAMP